MNILEYTRSSFTYRLRGIFSNNPSSYNDPTSYDLVVNNSDNSKYVNSPIGKCYNSAILISGTSYYIYMISPNSGYSAGWENNNKFFTDSFVQTGDETLYHCQTSYTATIDGQTIVYNRNYGIPSGVYTTDLPVFNNVNDFLAYITAPTIQNVWHSVKSISGALGTFSFTSLPDEVLTGEAITGLRQSDFDICSDQTSFFRLTNGLIAEAAPVPVMYSGDECY